MTLKEMFKKIEGYNQIAEIMGTDKIYLGFNINASDERFTNLKDLKKWVNEEFIEELASVVLNFDQYEFDTDRAMEFTYRWPIGTKASDTVIVGTYLYIQ